MNTTYYVYSISHKVTGKWYIGSRTKIGCHPDELFRPREKYIEGKSKGYKKGYFTSSKLVRKNIKLDGGIKNFKIESVKIFDSREKALFCEALLHKLFDLKNDKEYLNQHNAGEKFSPAGRQVSPETRKKMSLAKKGKKSSNYGKKASLAARKRMSEINKGKTLSPETRRKISNSLKGNKNPFYGKKHENKTCEHCSKIIPICAYVLYHGDNCKENPKNKNNPVWKISHTSEETRKKMSESMRALPKIECTHCGRLSDPGNHKKSHGDNCKENPKNKNNPDFRANHNSKLKLSCPHCGYITSSNQMTLHIKKQHGTFKI